jgi:hypothetical protein
LIGNGIYILGFYDNLYANICKIKFSLKLSDIIIDFKNYLSFNLYPSFSQMGHMEFFTIDMYPHRSHLKYLWYFGALVAVFNFNPNFIVVSIKLFLSYLLCNCCASYCKMHMVSSIASIENWGSLKEYFFGWTRFVKIVRMALFYWQKQIKFKIRNRRLLTISDNFIGNYFDECVLG